MQMIGTEVVNNLVHTERRLVTPEDIDTIIKQMHEAVDKLRALSPLWDMYQEGVDLNSVEWAEH